MRRCSKHCYMFMKVSITVVSMQCAGQVVWQVLKRARENSRWYYFSTQASRCIKVLSSSMETENTCFSSSSLRLDPIMNSFMKCLGCRWTDKIRDLFARLSTICAFSLFGAIYGITKISLSFSFRIELSHSQIKELVIHVHNTSVSLPSDPFHHSKCIVYEFELLKVMSEGIAVKRI